MVDLQAAAWAVCTKARSKETESESCREKGVPTSSGRPFFFHGLEFAIRRTKPKSLPISLRTLHKLCEDCATHGQPIIPVYDSLSCHSEESRSWTTKNLSGIVRPLPRNSRRDSSGSISPQNDKEAVGGRQMLEVRTMGATSSLLAFRLSLMTTRRVFLQFSDEANALLNAIRAPGVSEAVNKNGAAIGPIGAPFSRIDLWP